MNAKSNMNPKSITTFLLIEDNPGDARLLREVFNEQGPRNHAFMHVGSMTEAESYLSGHGVDVILLDLGLPDVEGLEAVRRAHAAAPATPLVVLTGRDDESLAAQALKEGAQDYLVKGQIEGRALLRAIRYAIERKTMEDAVFLEQERAQVTLNCIGDAVACTDVGGRITFLNVIAETMTGWAQEEAVGRPMNEVFQIVDSTTGQRILGPDGIDVSLNRNVRLPPNCTLLRRDSLEIPIENSVATIRNRRGQATGAVVIFRDVSIAREMTRDMTHAAHHDFLTGLPNRMLLNDRIDHAIALSSRQSSVLAVLFLDLDGFKHINDSLGHAVGDRLLQSIAGRLLECVRESDTVSRQGGDEFVVLISGVDEDDDAASVAGRILQCVVETHFIDKHELHVTASIGVATYPDDGDDAETLIKHADTAMYQAKEGGRQRFRFFKPDMNIKAVERQSIEEGLRRALERDEFALHYQPKIDLQTGSINGAEALIRWTHPVRGVVSPAQFIPVAEECGLIVPIGQWVLREACRQVKAWIDSGLPAVPVAVNVSAKEFREENFLKQVLAVLDETGLDPRLLELELTEGVLMKRIELTAAILQTLREMGIMVAVDDFGTGYSSLSYLRKFPVDVLKIDQSFVRQISAAGDDTTIVTAVINMARSLKLRVVAEGVETLEQLTFLREHHCDEAQGYYFSRPVPAQQFARLLHTGLSPEGRDGTTSADSMSGVSLETEAVPILQTESIGALPPPWTG